MNPRLTRRDAVRLAAGGALAAVPALAVAGPALAGRTWCRTDPALLINGQRLDVYIDSADGYLTDTTGPIQVRVGAPSGSTIELIGTDNGFGYGYDVTVDRSDLYRNTSKYFEVRVTVLVPSKAYHKLMLAAVPRNPYTSSSTSWPTWTNTSTVVSTTIAY